MRNTLFFSFTENRRLGCFNPQCQRGERSNCGCRVGKQRTLLSGWASTLYSVLSEDAYPLLRAVRQAGRLEDRQLGNQPGNQQGSLSTRHAQTDGGPGW